MYRKPGIVEFAYPLGIFEVALRPVKSVQIVTVLLVGHVNGVGCVGINRFCLGFITPVIRIDVPNAVGHISSFMCFDLFSRRLGLFFFRLFFLFLLYLFSCAGTYVQVVQYWAVVASGRTERKKISNSMLQKFFIMRPPFLFRIWAFLFWTENSQ